MSDIRKLFKHSSHYFAGHVLTLMAGFISFPIFTRVFSVSDYGVMSLVSITLVFVTALAKLGINKGSARFYEEFNCGKRKGGVNIFYSTLFFGGLTVSAIMLIIYYIAIKFLAYYIEDTKILNLLSLCTILICIRSVSTILMSFLNAEQRSKLFTIIRILQKYGIVILSIFFTFYIIKGLYGYYFGIIIAELLMTLFLVSVYIKNKQLDPKYFNKDFFLEATRFGLPLVVFEFSGIFLTFGDRYFLQYFLNSSSVGLYSVGYNLSTYVAELLIISFGSAMYPMCMEIWTKKGVYETKIFLSKVLKYFLLLAIPLAFGFIAVGKEITTVLASAKYSSAYIILPYLITGIFIGGSANILGVGLYINKKTHIITGITIIAVIINILLNIIMIPKFGIRGAAFATLIAYITSTLLIIHFSFKTLPLRIYFKDIFKYLIFSLIMFCIMCSFRIEYNILNLLAKIFLGLFVYLILIIGFISDIRNILIERIGYLKYKFQK